MRLVHHRDDPTPTTERSLAIDGDAADIFHLEPLEGRPTRRLE